MRMHDMRRKTARSDNQQRLRVVSSQQSRAEPGVRRSLAKRHRLSVGHEARFSGIRIE